MTDITPDALTEVEQARADLWQRMGGMTPPNGTGLPGDSDGARHARKVCQQAAAAGTLAWRHLLREDVNEAFAESDPAALRAQLVTVAATAVCWVEAIDRRAGSSETRAERFAADLHDQCAPLLLARVTAQDYHASRDNATGHVELRIGGSEGTVVIDLGEDGDEILTGLLDIGQDDEDVIVLERPAELGLNNDEGEDLLVLNDSGIIRLYPPDAAWFDLRPDEAREMAAQLAAMADAAEAAFPQLAGGHQAGSEAGQ